MTLEKACEIAAYKPKWLIDDSYIVRKETGEDFIEREAHGKPTLGIDGAAVLCGYVDLRNAGYPVKLAGAIMGRVRTAMRDYPEADQITIVLLANRSVFAVPTSQLDLSSGYTSGSYLVAATLIDVRNLRERVQRAIKAYEPGSEAEDEAA
jgi:hypothetical protein